MDADGSGNKRLTEKSIKQTNKKQHIDYGLKSEPIYMLLFIFIEGMFFRNRMKLGRRQTALPPEKSIVFLFKEALQLLHTLLMLLWVFCFQFGDILQFPLYRWVFA